MANGINPGKKYEVIKATQREIDGVEVGGRKYKFGRNGGFMVNDKGAAREIEKEYGHREGNGEVVVSEVEIHEPGHNYKFGPSAAFSRAWDEFEKRRNAKRNAENAGDDPEVEHGEEKKEELDRGRHQASRGVARNDGGSRRKEDPRQKAERRRKKGRKVGQAG